MREDVAAFAAYLRGRDLMPGTIENYLRCVRTFTDWAHETVTKELVAVWRRRLCASYTTETVNGMLMALNCFLGHYSHIVILEPPFFRRHGLENVSKRQDYPLLTRFCTQEPRSQKNFVFEGVFAMRKTNRKRKIMLAFSG